MLDVGLIRRQPDLVRRGLEAKGEVADIDWFRQLDKDFRAIVTELESMKARQNKLSPEIGRKMKAGEDASAERAEVAELKAKQKHLVERKDLLEEDLKKILMRLPNLPAEDVPVGSSDADNVVTDTWGEPRAFEFAPKAHWDLGDDLGLLDSQRAAKLSGSGFSLMFGPFAQLERALWNYMLDLHTREHGYQEVATPYLVLGDALEGTGQLPKFESEMYGCKDDDLWLIPTAEVPLTNIHRREIVPEERLPIRYTGFTPCFRREAGAAGADTRGLIRTPRRCSATWACTTACCCSARATRRSRRARRSISRSGRPDASAGSRSARCRRSATSRRAARASASAARPVASRSTCTR
jgi:seryl-tRNA synthetase